MPHAECTLPDGTTVAAGFTVADGHLNEVQVVGPQAEKIAEALNRSPADLEAAALAARIRAAVPFGVAWPAGSSVAIAQAVRRAIDSRATLRVGSFTPGEIDELTAGWKAYPWRILPERPFSAAMNVALDEVLSDRGSISLRFWKWNEPAVVLGRCQSVRNEVDRDALHADGVALVRRITGGGAMFVQPEGTITYSLILPDAAVAGLTIRQSYEACDAWVVRGLRELGIDAHHVAINDLAWAEGKIGGAAQARRRGVVLHHTTIAYDLKSNEMTRYLRLGRHKVAANGVASAAKVVSPLTAQTALSREAIVWHLVRLFQGFYGGRTDSLAPDEVAAAEELVRTKYGRPEWTEEFA